MELLLFQKNIAVCGKPILVELRIVGIHQEIGKSLPLFIGVEGGVGNDGACQARLKGVTHNRHHRNEWSLAFGREIILAEIGMRTFLNEINDVVLLVEGTILNLLCFRLSEERMDPCDSNDKQKGTNFSRYSIHSNLNI